MTEREQIIRAEAKAYAQSAVTSMEFLDVAEDDELFERIDRGQLQDGDTNKIFDLAIEHKVFNPGTHVAIEISEHERLLDRVDFLDCLDAAGIDNTTAYEEGCRIYREDKGDD